MKALIQRVLSASVSVDGRTVGECKKGYMILFCAVEGDGEDDIDLLARKTVKLRINRDEEGKKPAPSTYGGLLFRTALLN